MCAVRAAFRHRSLLVLGLLVLPACGTQVVAVTRCTPAPAQAIRTSHGAFSATADARSVPPGDVVSFAVVVQGPATYKASCADPVQLLVADSAQLQVYSATAASGPSSPCGSVVVPGDKHVVYTVVWQVDPTLPYGSYVAELVVGDSASLRLGIALVAAPSLCAEP
jgi:hypothetical protein